MIEVAVRKQLRDYALDVAFEVGDRECLALVGPTGCGKTTTLRLIAGLDAPDKGRVILDGRVLVDTSDRLFLPPQRRQVGMVFQDYALLPHLSVLGNVMYGARGRGAGAVEARRVALEALAAVHLPGLDGLRPAALSGGQQQRVALARALASGARALLMDEPMSALDTSTRRAVRSQLRQTISALGLQTVIVTHDPVDAMTVGDRVCVLQQGKVVQVGTRCELLAAPCNQFVADFVGVNLLRGRASMQPGGLCRLHCGGTQLYCAGTAEGPAQLVCSPWDVSLSIDEPEGSALNVIRGTVAAITHLGARTRVTVEGNVTVTAEITHASEQRLGLGVGKELYAAFKASAARVYQ